MGLFGPEKITFTLEKYDYKPGDEIQGKINLNLKKPVNARKLEISLLGKRKTKRRTSKGTSTQYEKVYDFTIPVSGEKEYHKESYPFKIKIPSDIHNLKRAEEKMQDKLEDKLGAAGTLISSVTMGASRTEWFVKAQLDIPKKLDVKKSQEIVISD